MEDGLAVKLANKRQAKELEISQAEASLKAKLEQGREEERLRTLRSKIEGLQTKKQAIETAMANFESSNQETSVGKGEYKKERGEVITAEADVAQANKMLAEIIRVYPEVFGPKGIKTPEELAADPEYSGEKEVVHHKDQKTKLEESQQLKTGAADRLHERVKSLLSNKKALEAVTPEELKMKHKVGDSTLSLFSDRPKTLGKIHEYLDTLAKDIETLERQTPERQEEERQKLKVKYDKALKDRPLLGSDYGGAEKVPFVKAGDVKEAEIWSKELVAGQLHAAVGDKLKAELDDQKKKEGITDMNADLARIASFPEQVRELRRKVAMLAMKRQEVVRAIRGDPSAFKSRIQSYFGRRPTVNAINAEKDFAETWVVYTEDHFFGNIMNEHQFIIPDSELTSRDLGVPQVFSKRLAGKELWSCIEKIDTGGNRVSTEAFFDTASFGEYVDKYDKFLDSFSRIINEKPELIAAQKPSGFRIGEVHNSLDAAEYEHGIKSSDGKGWRYGMSLSDKTKDVMKKGSTLKEMQSEVGKQERLLDKNYSARHSYLDAIIDWEWTAEEFRAFLAKHPDAQALGEKMETLKAERPVAEAFNATIPVILNGLAGLNEDLENFETSLKANGTIQIDGRDYENYRLDEARERFKQLQEANPGRKIKLVEEVSVKVEPRYGIVRDFKQEKERADSSLADFTRNLTIHKEKKRPWMVGASDFDTERTRLEKGVTDEGKKVSDLRLKLQNIKELEQSLTEWFSPLAYRMTVGRFYSSYYKNGTKPLIVLSALQSVAQEILAEKPPEDPQGIVAGYEKLKTDLEAKKQEARRLVA